jgi:hypothetical protein
MTSYPPRESAKTDYAIPKPTRLNLLVPPSSSSSFSFPPPEFSGVPDTYISQARILAEANPISRETQSERIKRVRKLAEDKFRIDQEKIKRANRDRNDLGYKGDISDDPIIIEDMDRPNGVGSGHRLPTEVEPNLARPHLQAGGDVRIPSRYQTTTSTYTSTTTGHTSASTYTLKTDNRGTASVHVSDISDTELHKRITKEMAEKAERHRQRDLQKERQRKRDIEEVKYKAAKLAQEAREKELDAAHKERKRREREWERQNGREYEEAEEAFQRSRRGSTPLFNSAYGSGPGTDEDHWGKKQRGDGWGEGDGKRGEGSGYGRVHNPTSTRSNSREREKKERERYLSRWNKLLSNSKNSDSDSDMIIETELSYSDIPWPIYAKSKLDKKSISLFLSNVALLPIQGGILAGKEGKEAERKTLREAIRNFHPDRFLSKVLPRVREGEREKVKEGMEVCSRVLTDLIMENSKSR